jgi:hypothetical protein
MDIDRNRPQTPKILVHRQSDLVWENSSSMVRWDRMVEAKAFRESDLKVVEC